MITGLPGPQWVPQIESGDVVVGEMTSFGPRRQCRDCGLSWGGLPFESEAAIREIADRTGTDGAVLIDRLDDRFTPRRVEGLVHPAENRHSAVDLPVVEQYFLGEPALVVVTIYVEGVAEVDEFVDHGRPPRPSHPERRGEPLVLPPIELVCDPIARSQMLMRLIKDSGRRRRARFVRCGSCGWRLPPEQTDEGCCHRCLVGSGLRF